MPGVVRTRVGYAGGTTASPTYHAMGDHTESFQVDFDPKRISYERLCDLFWASHNPCAGSWSRQYRSVLFYGNEEQKKTALETKAKLEKSGIAVATAIEELRSFTRAEDYHQKYYLRSHKELMNEFRGWYPIDRDFVNSTAAARANAWVAGDRDEATAEAELPRLGLSEKCQAILKAALTR